MGGHGGLNILPQKSWNVYGRKNRLKVVQDEEVEAQKLAAERSKAEHVGREARLAALKDDGTPNGTDAVQVGETATGTGGHINFWADWESSAANAIVVEEQKNERRNRGDPKTQTSDARFDQSFKMMHGLTGQAPWYARRRPADGDGDSRAGAPAVAATLPRGHGQPSSGASAGLLEGGDAGRRGDHKAEKKRKKRHKEHKESGVKRRRTEEPLVKKTLDELRHERLLREATEAARTRALLRNTT